MPQRSVTLLILHVGEPYFCLPSWIPPKTWSLGRTRRCTVFNSSTQPTLCSSFGTQSRKPEGKMQSIHLIFSIQVRFHLVFQEAIIYWTFITLPVILTSPLKHTMAFKKLFTVTLSSLGSWDSTPPPFPLPCSLPEIMFLFMWAHLLNYKLTLFFMSWGPVTFVPSSVTIFPFHFSYFHSSAVGCCCSSQPKVPVHSRESTLQGSCVFFLASLPP